MSEYQGNFVWYELMTSDAPAAKKFYSDVVGWTAADNNMAGFTYTVLSAGDAMIAGLMEMPEEPAKAGALPFWIGYIWADDVDAMAEKVKQAGGSVHREPADIPGIGRFAVVADPHVAVFCLFHGERGGDGNSAPSAPPRPPGPTGWRELVAGDPSGALPFLSCLLGREHADSCELGANVVI